MSIVLSLVFTCCFPWRRMEEWGCSSIIIHPATIWKWVVSFTIRLLYPHGSSPRYPLDRRLSGHREPVWTVWRREKLFAPTGSRTPVVLPVAIPSELSWLLLRNMYLIKLRTTW
jgi:hypothetical protein